MKQVSFSCFLLVLEFLFLEAITIVRFLYPFPKIVFGHISKYVFLFLIEIVASMCDICFYILLKKVTIQLKEFHIGSCNEVDVFWRLPPYFIAWNFLNWFYRTCY